MIRELVTLEITGADIPSTLRSITDRGITILCTVPKGELTAQLTVERRDEKHLIALCRRRGDDVRVVRRSGASRKLSHVWKRPVLTLGLLLIMFLTLYLPSRVLFLRVEGNDRIPSRKIMETARQCGIGFGASRRAVRSQNMKNALLEALPELKWAGVNTEGCVAVISVRERPEETAGEQSAFGHVLAASDAVILSCTATRGTLLCSPGQAVAAGEILISGYTDTGLVIRAEQAEGEIYGLTRRNLIAVTPGNYRITEKSGREKRKYTLLLGKKRINLWKDSGIWDTTCDRMYEEYYITLPGGFQLPLALAVERFSCREWREEACPLTRALLEDFGRQYLNSQMIAGRIRNQTLDFSTGPGLVRMAGEYECVELVGIVQRLQIGEENGEND